MYKLRFDLPNLLRTLAHLDERESTTAIFNRCMQEAHNMNGEVAEFTALYAECHPILAKAREREDSTSMDTAINSAAAPQQQPSIQPSNTGNNSALATQQSIQNFMQSGNPPPQQQQAQPQPQQQQSQEQQQQPLMFDNDPSMNFIQL